MKAIYIYVYVCVYVYTCMCVTLEYMLTVRKIMGVKIRD